MGFKGFNEETMAALQNQGGVPGDPNPTLKVEPKVDTPDIELNIDPKTDPKVEPKIDPKVDPVVDPKVDPKVEPVIDPKVEPKVDPKVDPDPTNADILEQSGFTQDELQARIIADGGFSDALIAELKGKIDPALVDARVSEFNTALGKAQAQQKATQSDAEAAAVKATDDMNKFIYTSVGGEDNFNAMSDVLKGAVDKGTIDKINAKLSSTNKDVVAEGMKEAVDSYNKATGRGGKMMEGDPGGVQSPEFQFITKADYHTVMKSEKYKTDPIYSRKMDEMRLKSRQADHENTLPGQWYKQGKDGHVYAI